MKKSMAIRGAPGTRGLFGKPQFAGKKQAVYLVFLVLMLVALPLHAQKNMAVGVYGTNQYLLGDMGEFGFCTAGGGIAFDWKVPKVPYLGVSARVEGGAIIPKDKTIESWWQAGAMASVWAAFPLNTVFTIRPELGYGVLLHGVRSDSRSLNGVFVDQQLQVAAGLRFSIPKTDVTIELAPLYTFVPEKEYAGHKVGFRAGVYYAF